MYDFANSGYTTVVITAVFNAYFVGGGRAATRRGRRSRGPRRSRSRTRVILRHRPARRRLGRRARGEEDAAARRPPWAACCSPRRSTGAGPGDGRAGARLHRRLQLLLRHGREPDRGVPARARRLARRMGTRVGLGMELRLLRRPRRARHLPRLGHDGAVAAGRPRRGGAGDDAHHRGVLRARRRCPRSCSCASARCRRRRLEHAPWAPRARDAARTRATLPRPAPLPALHRVLPGGHHGGDRARRDLRRAGDEVHHAADHHADPGGERDRRDRRVRLRLRAGRDRPRARARASRSWAGS